MKSLLVPMMMGRFERAAVELAGALASRHGGMVDVLVGLSAVSPLAGGWDYLPASPYDTLDEAAQAAAEALAADAAPILAGVPHSVRVAGAFWLTPSEQTLAAAAAADLIVLGRPKAPLDADDRLFGATLLGAGRPVLLVPESAGQGLDLRHVAVAWRPGREAARAVHDAIPLLRAAQSVRIVRILGVAEQADDAGGADAVLLAHLERHGIRPQFECVPAADAAKGERILEFAQAMAADLIVAGGYGHPKAYEQVFGGVTRALLRKSPTPVLFSH